MFDLAIQVFISIHALREEGDFDRLAFSFWIRISIHALREEGDFTMIFQPFNQIQFLSTPSARRATFGEIGVISNIVISIHALREEGDFC